MSCINLIKYFINKLKTIRIHAVLVKWCVISLYQFCKWWLLFGLVTHLSFSYSFNHTFVYPTRAIIVLLSRSCLNYCSPTFACKKQKHHVLAFQSITYSLMPAHTRLREPHISIPGDFAHPSIALLLFSLVLHQDSKVVD